MIDGTFKVSRKAFYDAMADSSEVQFFAGMADRIAKYVAAESVWSDLMDSTARALMAMGIQPSDCLIEHIEDDQCRPVRRVLKAYGQPVMEVLTERTPTGPYSWTVTHTPRFIAWPTECSRPTDGLRSSKAANEGSSPSGDAETLTAPQVRADSMSGET